MTRGKILGGAGIAVMIALGLTGSTPAGAQYACPPGYVYYPNYGCAPPGYFAGPPYYYAYPDFGFEFFYGPGWVQRWGGYHGPGRVVPRGGAPHVQAPQGGAAHRR